MPVKLMYNFKFHYVSINSNKDKLREKHKRALNSIMFLLIHSKVVWYKLCYSALNSIMFLLIPTSNSLIVNLLYTLNSIMFLLILQKSLFLLIKEFPLNSIMFLLIPVPKPTAYLLNETPLFCRPLQNISFLSHSSSYVLATPPILAIFYFCRFPAFFTLSQVDRNHYIFIISSFLLA